MARCRKNAAKVRFDSAAFYLGTENDGYIYYLPPAEKALSVKANVTTSIDYTQSLTDGEEYYLLPVYKTSDTSWSARNWEYDAILVRCDVSTGINDIDTTEKTHQKRNNIYTIDGRKIKSGENLPKGIYIINGKKIKK